MFHKTSLGTCSSPVSVNLPSLSGPAPLEGLLKLVQSVKHKRKRSHFTILSNVMNKKEMY